MRINLIFLQKINTLIRIRRELKMDKETVSQLKKETALKNFRYNRFLLLR
ncbi:hypothetical protein RV13_GL002616 [Enterococcus raffinosus]|nr:hypothetical protein RV13_GL002616 [Enterococcus raffinosus]